MARMAVFFVSSGRSGTQWLCDLLQTQFADRCVARHETLQADYNIRRFLGNASAIEAAAEKASIDQHIRFIKAIDDSIPYIETGWTSVGVLPYLADQLGDRFRLVQLTRHPVNSALSLSCQGMHQPGRNDSSEEWSYLDPFIDGSTYPELREKWSTMNPYERCLYQWYEIHRFGDSFAEQLSPDRFMRAQFEQMVTAGSGCLEEILHFCGLSGDVDLEESRKKRFDRYPSFKAFSGDWRSIHSYPKFVELTVKYGYGFDEKRLDEVASRNNNLAVKTFRRATNKLRRHYRKYVQKQQG